jgi:AraC family cel operon transcriptional repressor
MSVLRLKAVDYLDPVTEAHYAFFRAPQEITTVPHCHDFYELFLVVNGRIQHVVNQKKQQLAAGALTFIRPNDIHHFCRVSNNDCQLINLSFAQNTMEDLLNYLGAGFQTKLLTAPLPPTMTLPLPIKNQVQEKLEDLKRIPLHDKQKARTALRILLFDLLTHYLTSERPQPIEGSPEWFNKLCRELQKPEHFVGGVETAYLLAEVTPEHMARTFQKYTNKTLTQYINEQRLNYAANLLLHTDRTILEIALDVGFDSLSHFYHLFKDRFGGSPAQFRKANQRSLIPR